MWTVHKCRELYFWEGVWDTTARNVDDMRRAVSGKPWAVPHTISMVCYLDKGEPHYDIGIVIDQD